MCFGWSSSAMGMLHIFKWALDFAKDVLIDSVVSSFIPLQLPDIKKFVKIPLVGKVHIFSSEYYNFSC